MATFRIGKLGLKTQPIQDLADWDKARKFDWRSLQMGLHEVAVWDCTKQAFTPRPNKGVPVPVILTTSSVNPMGRIDKVARQKRYDRFVKASGLGSPQAFGKALEKNFVTPTVPFPEADVLAAIDKRYRHVICYERLDRFILITPRQQNPRGDYLILCLPEKVRWWAVTVGICGTEKRVEEDPLLPFENQLPIRTVKYVFLQAGTYQKLPQPRTELISLRNLVKSPRYATKYTLPNSVQSPVWRAFLRDDANMKIAKSKKLGTTTLGALGPYGIHFLPNPNYLWDRHEAEKKRLWNKFG
ncbi:MAG: hypothetical protein AAGA15_02540 [Pseudomonadota bacterium]